MPDNRRMTEDERFELTSAAAASERRNRPKHLLLLPAALLLVAGLALVVSIYSHESSRIRIEREQARYNRLVQGVAQLQELSSEPGQQGAGLYEPIPDLLSRMERFSTESGLARAPSIPTTRTDMRTEGAKRTLYVYSTVTDPSIGALLEWVSQCTSNVPGLFVNSITLKPAGSQGWTMDVTYARWEREN